MFGLVRLAAIAGLASTLPAFAGDFGRTKTTVPVTIVSPPEMPLPGRTFTLEQAQGAAFRDWAVLKLAIEQALASEFTPAASGADLKVTVAVSNYAPATAKRVAATENRRVVVGKKTVKNIFTGKPMQVDEYAVRPVRVDYWEARGEIALQISVDDASGARLDSSFTPRSEYYRKVEMAVRGVASSQEPMPTADELRGLLIREVAAEVQKRYTKSRETIEVPVAIDDELRPGNALAASGQWQPALASWRSAQMRKNPGDRLYNMAVAHEALAYQALDAGADPATGQETFQQAVELYQQALKLDPREKVIQEAMERSAALQASFGRAREQYAAEERRLEIEAATASLQPGEAHVGGPGSKNLDEPRTDTPDEVRFREHVRGRWKALGEAPAQDRQDELIQLGRNAFKLDGESAQRVVGEEAERVGQRKANRESYRGAVADYLRDGPLSASQREQLKELAGLLELTPEDASAIEAEFETAKPAPAAKPAAKPAAAKPARPTAPRATPGVKP